MKYIILSIIGLFLAGTYWTEYRLNKTTDDYRCYLGQEYAEKASENKCKGYYKYCSGCIYKKNYDKAVKQNKN